MNEKFNTIMPETTDHVLCMQVDKPISQEGYRDNFLPRLKQMLENTGEIRLLVYFKTFKGWEEGATAFDMETTAKYGKHVKKLAFVNPPEKVMFKTKLQKSMFAGEISYFEETELDRALSWVKA